MTLDDLTAEIQKAGYSWALEGGPDGHYAAEVRPLANSDYIGDALAGPGASYGGTAIEALKAAWDKARAEAATRTP